MTPDLWVAVVVGVSGSIAAMAALLANRDNRVVAARVSATAMMAQLAEELRDELDRERKARTRLEQRVLDLERQLYAAGIVPVGWERHGRPPEG